MLSTGVLRVRRGYQVHSLHTLPVLKRADERSDLALVLTESSRRVFSLYEFDVCVSRLGRVLCSRSTSTRATTRAICAHKLYANERIIVHTVKMKMSLRDPYRSDTGRRDPACGAPVAVAALFRCRADARPCGVRSTHTCLLPIVPTLPCDTVCT